MKRAAFTGINPGTKPGQDRARGYSLLEVLCAVALIGMFIGAAFFGLLKLNAYATANRLHTCASHMVQEVIDQALSVRPFYPTVQSTAAGDPFDSTRNTLSGTSTTGVPSALMVTQSLGAVKSSTIPIVINPDILISGTTATLKTAAQVLSAATVITGTLQTIVHEADIATGGTTAAPSTSGTSYLRRINVTLTYQFCGITSTIQRTCLRAPDQ